MTFVVANMGIIVTLLGLAVPFFLRLVFKDRAEAKESLFRSGVEIAFHAAQAIAPATPNKVDDVVLLALQKLDEYLKAHGQDVTQKDAARATVLFQAMVGAKSGVVQLQK